MARSKENFLARFPEFEPASSGSMIDSALSEAARRVDAEVWGDKTDDGVYCKTAHLLAISPFGRNARMIAKDGTTTYSKEFSRMVREVTPGFRVA